MTNNTGDDLKNILMAGIGAVAHLSEKSKEWIGEMSKKGEEVASSNDKEFISKLAQKGADAIEQGKVITGDLKDKFQQTIERVKTEAQNFDMDEVTCTFADMSDEVLSQIRDKIDDILKDRDDQPEEVDVEVDVEPETEPESSDEA